MNIYEEYNFDNISPYLRFIHIDDVVEGMDYIIPWRTIYDYELIFLVHGELSIETENDKYTLKAGEIHIMPPFLHHKRTGKGEFCLYSMHFDLFYTGKNNNFSALEIYSKPIHQKTGSVADDNVLIHRPFYTLNNFELPNKLVTKDPSEYTQILNEALYIFNNKSFGYELSLKICVLRILKNIISDMHIDNIHRKLSKHDRKIIKCIESIKSNYSEKINIDVLALEMGFTSSYFRRLFKRMTNKSPNEYIIDVRINQAIDYMRTGMYSISEISKKVGYDDIHYFSRLFKNKKGCSPTNFMNL